MKKGIKIDVITTNSGLEKSQNLIRSSWTEIEGVRIRYFPYFLGESYTFSPRLFGATLFESKIYDLIHITAIWNFPVLAGSLGAAIHKKPYIISPRGSLYEEAMNVKSAYLKKLYFGLVARHYVNKADALHFTTVDEKERVTSFLKLENRSFVIPNGFDLAGFNKLPEKGSFKKKHPILSDKKYILFLGRLTKQKGLDLLVEAFGQLTKDRKDLFLVIAGGDDEGYKSLVMQWLSNHGLLDKVLFTGILTGGEKLSAFVDAEMFVLPSYFENFGMAVVEAMLCGVPVVISNRVGICTEIQKNRAGIIIDLTPRSLFTGMKSLLENPDLSKNISKQGKKLAEENYDVNKIADMMIKAYEGVINCHKN
ncbi:MAG: glycosyltransferase [Candidatus Melainabacteria bacterium]|nr:glycosyltransferase [Candidatus Melainabacteria bacterium]